MTRKSFEEAPSFLYNSLKTHKIEGIKFYMNKLLKKNVNF